MKKKKTLAQRVLLLESRTDVYGGALHAHGGAISALAKRVETLESAPSLAHV